MNENMTCAADLLHYPMKITHGLSVYKKIFCSGKTVEQILEEYHLLQGTAVFWQMHQILWGRIENGTILTADGSAVDNTYTMEARFFNEEAEIHLYFQEGQMTGRYVHDGEGEQRDYVDSESRLWGSTRGEANGFVSLIDENRKLKMVVPVNETVPYYALVTRNYVGYAPEDGQAGYEDYRFVKIIGADMKEVRCDHEKE